MNKNELRNRILQDRAEGLAKLPEMSRQWAQAVCSHMSAGEDIWLSLWESCAQDHPDVFYAMCRLTAEVFEANPERFPSVPKHIKGFGLRKDKLDINDPDPFLTSDVMDRFEEQEDAEDEAEAVPYRQRAREQYLASLTPEQRADLEKQEAENLRFAIEGLLERDVQ